MRRIQVLVCLTCLCLLAASVSADGDEAGIRAAVSDYVDAAYEVGPLLVERSIPPHPQKVGSGNGQVDTFGPRRVESHRGIAIVVGDQG